MTIKPITAKDEYGNPLHGYSVMGNLNARLALLYDKESDASVIAVTDVNEGEGHHIYISPVVFKELLDQYFKMAAFNQKEN